MEDTELYKVRPWPDGTDFSDVFRVFLPPSSLLLHKVSPGDICTIHTAERSVFPAVVWQSSDKINEKRIRTSKALQKAYGLKLGDEISIKRSNALPEDASEVSLCEMSQDKSGASLPGLDDIGRSHWAWLLEYSLKATKKIVPGMLLSVKAKGEERTFKMLYINSSDQLLLYNTTTISVVKIVDDSIRSENSDRKTLVVPGSEVGGLNCQLQQLNDILAMYSAKMNNSRFEPPSFFQPCQGGILLHGAPGTGKSLVLRKIREAGWRKVHYIDNTKVGQRTSESETAIKSIFSDALRFQPSVIFIDSLEVIAGRSSTMGQILSRELERLNKSQTIAIGATRSLSDIDQDLRSAGRFEIELEMPIPDSNCRAEILKVLCGLPKDIPQTILDDIATRTHGFVGADLKKLLGYAVRTNEIRHDASRWIRGNNTGDFAKPEELLDGMKDDFEKAFLKVRPTAMQEIFIEIPKVKWSDIGGQSELKKRLEQAVVWPFKVKI